MSKENLAFRHEYSRDIPFPELYKDIESYLGEYRLPLQRYDYDVSFSGRESGEPHLRDVFRGETMAAKAMRSVANRENAGQNASYERAELTGILSLENQLSETQVGETVLWASPERPEEEYGSYGFWYVGTIIEDPDDPEGKVIHFSALKVDEPTIEQFNQALSFFTQKPVDFKTPEDFLANPEIVKIPKVFVMKFIENHFDFKLDYRSDSQQQIFFKQAMTKLLPLITRYHTLTQSGAPKEESKKVFNAIENFAEELKKGVTEIQISTDGIIRIHGSYDPRPVAGSCGISSFRKNNIFGNLTSLQTTVGAEKNWDYHDGQCVVCNQQSQVGPCSICKTCEKKFDQEESIPLTA